MTWVGETPKLPVTIVGRHSVLVLGFSLWPMEYFPDPLLRRLVPRAKSRPVYSIRPEHLQRIRWDLYHRSRESKGVRLSFPTCFYSSLLPFLFNHSPTTSLLFSIFLHHCDRNGGRVPVRDTTHECGNLTSEDCPLCYLYFLSSEPLFGLNFPLGKMWKIGVLKFLIFDLSTKYWSLSIMSDTGIDMTQNVRSRVT